MPDTLRQAPNGYELTREATGRVGLSELFYRLCVL